MEITSQSQLSNTREKLRLLEEEFATLQKEESLSCRAKDAATRSLKRLINQLKEEIARFEARQTA